MPETFEIFTKTKDNIQIAMNYYPNGFDSVVIIAPGWCMTKDSDAFEKISKIFTSDFDVITFDFRGHGKSSGFYTFGAKEALDLQAVIDFAMTKKYKKIYLAGFSLGASVTLISATRNTNIDKIIVVSVPTDFSKIENCMWKKEAWWETLKKFELKRFLSIRPNLIPLKKVKPIDIIDKIQIPILFIAGEKDPTVFAWHTKKLYEKAKCKKELKIFKNGYHAEDLYLHYKNEFTELCLNWLKNN